MKIFFLLSLLCLFYGGNVIAQNPCSHPPVTFPAGKTICDTRPLKTVFYDDFDGTQLKAPWITFKSWAGMPGGDHPNWSEGHTDRNVILKDENVVVSNGSVKLKVKRESSSWKCDTCHKVESSRYSGSYLALPYTNKSFNSGYFEARIKMPNFYKAHTTMWLWDGSGPAGNEIDIAEGYGNSGSAFWDAPPLVNYSTHAWWPNRKPSDNPCNLPHDAEVKNRFPNSTWWNWHFDRIYKSYDFNTYACDWDTSRVTFYLNGSEVGTVWKYYGYKDVWVIDHSREEFNNVPRRKLIKVWVGSTCSGNGNTIWNVTPGFPYHNPSLCQLRFTANLDNTWDMQNLLVPPLINEFLGEMEIDYVKIAQRTIDPGFTPCDEPLTSITGPTNLCGQNSVAYTASHPVYIGSWTTTPNIKIISQNHQSVIVTTQSNTTSGAGYVYYNPNGQNCYFANAQTASRRVNLWKPDNINVTVARFAIPLFPRVGYFLTASAPNLGIIGAMTNQYALETYEWEADYGSNYNFHYHGFGRTVSLPMIPWQRGSTTKIRWKLTVTNPCGVTIKQGQATYLAKMQGISDSTSELNEGAINNATAEITDLEAYENAIDERISKMMFSSEADTLDIIAAIEEVRMDELAPYLIDVPELPSMLAKMSPNSQTQERKLITDSINSISLSPNPAKDVVYLELSNIKDRDNIINISITDLFGRQVHYFSTEFSNRIPISIANLPASNYFLKVLLSSGQQVIRFVKE